MEALPQAEIAPAEFEPVIENADGAGRLVVVCDHASNFMPPEYAGLGLAPAERDAHIAWDPGALGVARGLARLFDAPLVHATVSRLVIDCNRPLDAPDLIPAKSEATAIPGNQAVSETERRHRIAAIHEPYHRAIEALIERRCAAGRESALVAVHSFTPRYLGVARPWPVGIVFDRDRRLADPLIGALRQEGLNVGVNLPYSPADRVYYTVTRHAEARGLPCVMIEIRNDQIVSEAEQSVWARRIGAHLAADEAVRGSRELSV